MNRRGFFSRVLGAVASVVVPIPASPNGRWFMSQVQDPMHFVPVGIGRCHWRNYTTVYSTVKKVTKEEFMRKLSQAMAKHRSKS